MKIFKRKLTALMLATIFSFSSLPLCASTTSSVETSYDVIFEKDQIIDIYVSISEEDWIDILENPTDEAYHHADITVNGETVNNVGFRTKGNITLSSVASSDSDRYSFRIKCDKYTKKQSLLGLDEFVINNMYSDSSYLREYLAYEAMAKLGIDVPKTAFANVYINGELFGFYLCVEALDDAFLSSHFGSNYKEGNFYKQDQGATLVYEPSETYSYSELKKGDDDNLDHLKNMIKVLNTMPYGEKGEIESVLDVDSALKYIATNTVLGNYDSYNGNQHHNYYFYENQEGLFKVVPWDFNMAFSGLDSSDVTEVPIDEPITSGTMEGLPMINNLLAVPEYKTRYYGYIQSLMDGLEDFNSRVDELATMIRPYVEADPTKFITMEQFENSLIYTTPNYNEGMTPPNDSTPPEWEEGTTPPELGEGMPPSGDAGTTPSLPEDGLMPPTEASEDSNTQEPTNGEVSSDKDFSSNEGLVPPSENMPSNDLSDFPSMEGTTNSQLGLILPGQTTTSGQLGIVPDQNGPGNNSNGMIMSSNISIVTYVTDRLINLKVQLTEKGFTSDNSSSDDANDSNNSSDNNDSNNSSDNNDPDNSSDNNNPIDDSNHSPSDEETSSDSSTLPEDTEDEVTSSSSTASSSSSHKSPSNSGCVVDATPSASLNDTEETLSSTLLTDLQGHWAQEAIEKLLALNLAKGTSSTSFSPNAGVTRGMFITLLGRLEGVAEIAPEASNFTDLDLEAYYTPYINWGAEQHIVKGITETSFAPNQPLTREALAVIVYNYLQSNKALVSTTSSVTSFSDEATISDWAKSSVSYLQQAGLITGQASHTFNPKETVTRGEAATIIARLLELNN